MHFGEWLQWCGRKHVLENFTLEQMPIHIESDGGALVTHALAHHLELSSDHRQALVAVRVQAEQFAHAKLYARIRLMTPGGNPSEPAALERTVELSGTAPDVTVYLEVALAFLIPTHGLVVSLLS